MLKVFRDNLKYLSWVLWLVILVFVVFLFTDFGSINPTGGSLSAAAARVGNYEISYAEFEQAYRQQEARLEQLYGQRLDSDTARQLGLHRQVMEFLVAEKILQAEGERMGIRVSDDEVREAILDYPVFRNEQGGFVGEESYRKILSNARMTPDSFESAVRQEILTDRVRNILNQNVFVSDAEVEKAYRDRVERAKIRFVRLPATQFADQVTLDDAEVAAYFADRQQDFEIPERRSVDYLMIDRGQLQAEVEITDAEVAAYYRENEADYAREEQVQARHILVRTGDERSVAEASALIEQARQRIAGGADFAAVAAELSEDPGSKDRGGDLGSFGRGQMVPPFEEAAFGAAPGELVGPVETDFGVHLIDVLGKSEGGQQPLAEVAASIRNRLAAERARTLAQTKAAELTERIEREDLDDPEALRALADQETGVTFLTTEPFGESDPVAGIGPAAAFTAAAFDAETGEIVGPIQIPRGWAILRVSEVREAHLPELSEVEADVRSALRERKQRQLARATLDEARERLAAGATTLDQLAEKLGVAIEESPEFGRTDPIGSLGINEAIARAALALDEGAVGGPIGDAGGAVLFEVVERQRFDPSTFAREKDSTRAELASQRANEMLSALVAARRDEMGVDYDPTFFENFELSRS